MTLIADNIFLVFVAVSWQRFRNYITGKQRAGCRKIEESKVWKVKRLRNCPDAGVRRWRRDVKKIRRSPIEDDRVESIGWSTGSKQLAVCSWELCVNLYGMARDTGLLRIYERWASGVWPQCDFIYWSRDRTEDRVDLERRLRKLEGKVTENDGRHFWGTLQRDVSTNLSKDRRSLLPFSTVFRRCASARQSGYVTY